MNGLSAEDLSQSDEDLVTLFAHRRDIAPDPAERFGSGPGAEAAGDLLLYLHHAQVPVGEVVVEGHSEVIHEPERLVAILRQPVEQVLRRRLFGAAPFPDGLRSIDRGRGRHLLVASRSEDRLLRDNAPKPLARLRAESGVTPSLEACRILHSTDQRNA